jgi:thiol:disulfide interchange protein
MPPASSFSTRARPTVLLSLAAVFLVARMAAGIYDARHPPRPGGLVNWRAIDGAVAAAAAEHKPILYDFSASWCEPCRMMERELFANAEAASFINSNFVAVRVTDDDRSPAAIELQSQHGVEGLPTLLIVHDPKGEPRRLEGYQGKRQTLAFLKRALVRKPPPGPPTNSER